jgi:ElaB/YqjD/DUF883 family membrane-anchored ribosome-binding protein
MSPSPEVNPFPTSETPPIGGTSSAVPPLGGTSSATTSTMTADEMVNRAAETAHRAVDRVAEKAMPAVERVRSGVSEAATVLQARADQFGQLQERWVEESRSYVREHPFTSVAAALAAGMLLARLLWPEHRA